jgi:hypothetical protein
MGMPFVAEGVGFEPSEDIAALNSFQVLRRACCPVRLVLSSAVLSRVSCYLVRLVLSCIIQFGLQRVCSHKEGAGIVTPFVLENHCLSV